jgi:hypothetical protein
MRRVGTERGNETCDLGYEAKYVWIKVKKILLPDRDEELDKETIAGIAESIEVLGLLHPIAVRRIRVVVVHVGVYGFDERGLGISGNK